MTTTNDLSSVLTQREIVSQQPVLPTSVFSSKIEVTLSSVAIIGMGYVGLPTALGLHSGGLRTLGIDISEHRLRTIVLGEADLIEEDQVRLDKALPAKDFELTTDLSRLSEADAVIVCVPTPLDRHLTPDLGPLRGACEAVVRHARAGQTILLTSTSFVGTTRQLLVRPLEERGFRMGEDIFVAFSPERIDPGNSHHTQHETPRVVGGVTIAYAGKAKRVLEVLTPSLHEVSSAEAAELTKLYENSFRAVNIALANEFAEICGTLSLDPIEVTHAAATKPYGFMSFYPGPGVGGHCIPCDPHYLLWQLRAVRGGAPLVHQAMTSIAHRPGHVVDRTMATLSNAGHGTTGARVLVVGVAYKPGVQDVRETSALEIIAGLIERGVEVDYHDPLIPDITLHDGRRLDSVPQEGVSQEGVSQPEGGNWDLALIHTVHPDHDYGWTERCPIVLDATYRFHTAAHREVV